MSVSMLKECKHIHQNSFFAKPQTPPAACRRAVRATPAGRAAACMLGELATPAPSCWSRCRRGLPSAPLAS